jgi:hypothetical protein
MIPIEAEFIGSRPRATTLEECQKLWQEMVAIQRTNGATWFRMTTDEARNLIWLEGWKVRPTFPYVEAEFNPSLAPAIPTEKPKGTGE